MSRQHSKEVIRTFLVRSGAGERSRKLRLRFHAGSPFTFIKRSAAAAFANACDLAEPEAFPRLKRGPLVARALAHLEVKMLGFWCRHFAYVVEDETQGAAYDVLIGDDYMQRYDVAVRTRAKHRGVVLNRAALELAQVVR